MSELLSEQSVAVEGSVNFRELGGYAAADGRKVRRNSLFRCGTLTHLTDVGQHQFADLDIGLVCDLRRDDERAEQPTQLTRSAPEQLLLPIDPGSAMQLREKLNNDGLDVEQRRYFMTSLTGELTRDHADEYRQMFDRLLAVDDGGFLVHCSAGKDRTGVASALLLHALGVEREVIKADYMLTNITIDYEGYVVPKMVGRYERLGAPDKEAIMALAGVHEAYLDAAYDGMHHDHEDVEAYLTSALGLSSKMREQLRERFLE